MAWYGMVWYGMVWYGMVCTPCSSDFVSPVDSIYTSGDLKN